MRLGLSTAAFYGGYETEEAAALLPRLGLDCCEVFLETISEYNAAFAAEVTQALDGLPAHSVHPLGTQFESSLFSKSARQRADAMDVFERVLEAGEALRARVYVYHGVPDTHRRGNGPNLPGWQDGLNDLCTRAAARGMCVGWENVWWCHLSRPEHVRAVREAVPDMRFVLDIKQAMHIGIDPTALIPEMGDRMVNVHVCDRDEEGALCLPGQGTFDFVRFFAALKTQGYDGPVILEPYSTLFTRMEQIEAALDALRDALYKADRL